MNETKTTAPQGGTVDVEGLRRLLGTTEAPPPWVEWSADYPDLIFMGREGHVISGSYVFPEDLRLAVGAVNALPALLDELQATREERDHYRAELEDIASLSGPMGAEVALTLCVMGARGVLKNYPNTATPIAKDELEKELVQLRAENAWLKQDLAEVLEEKPQ